MVARNVREDGNCPSAELGRQGDIAHRVLRRIMRGGCKVRRPVVEQDGHPRDIEYGTSFSGQDDCMKARSVPIGASEAFVVPVLTHPWSAITMSASGA